MDKCSRTEDDLDVMYSFCYFISNHGVLDLRHF